MKKLSVIIFTLSVSVAFLFLSCGNAVENHLNKIAEVANRTLPMQVDNATTLDETVSLGNKTFQYKYTLSNLKKEQIEEEFFSIAENAIKPKAINKLRRGNVPDIIFFRKNDITINHSYYDTDGELLLEIIITPEEYK